MGLFLNDHFELFNCHLETSLVGSDTESKGLDLLIDFSEGACQGSLAQVQGSLQAPVLCEFLLVQLF